MTPELWRLWAAGVRFWLQRMDAIMDPPVVADGWRYVPSQHGHLMDCYWPDRQCQCQECVGDGAL